MLGILRVTRPVGHLCSTRLLSTARPNGTDPVERFIKGWQGQALMVAGAVVGIGCGTAMVSSSPGSLPAVSVKSPPQAVPTPLPATSPFEWPELAEGIRRRAAKEVQLREYMKNKGPELQRRMAEARTRMDERSFNRLMVSLKNEVALDTQMISYGVKEPHARQKYLEKYGCVRWTDKALKRIVLEGPLVEIGAGLGHWERELRKLGADILAFDSAKDIPNEGHQKAVGVVAKGDERKAAEHSDRALFLCYPYTDTMAERAVQLYRGDTVVYIGEGRGGANATAGFFDQLENEWTVVEQQELDPFPECFERLFILKRRAP